MTRRYAPSAWLVAVVVAPVALYARLLRFVPFGTDDWQWAYQRPAGYLDALAGGQFPPRSFPLAFDGAGYAFPNFYPPLAHWASAALSAITGSPLRGVHLAFLAGLIGAGVFMFLLCKRLGGSNVLGFVGSFAYVALPYLIFDVFVRGALAETWAFMWFPAIVLAGLRALDVQRPSVALAFSVCGLVLSHTVLSLYFAAGCAVGLVLIWRNCGLKSVLMVAGSAAVGGALALWYLLPMRQGLQIIAGGDPLVMLATEQQVRAAARNADVVFVGLLPWVLLGAVAIRARSLRSRWATAALVASGVYTAYAYLPRLFQPFLPAAMAYIQFPWRVLGIAGFLGSIALVLMLGSFREKRRHALVLFATLAMALPIAGQAGTRRYGHVESQAAGTATYFLRGEFLPKSVSQAEAVRNAALRRRRFGGFTVRSGKDGMVVTPLRGEPPARQTLPLHYYPFYRATTPSGSVLPLENAAGYVALELSGTPVRITVVNPPSFWLGLGVGLAALLLLVAVRRRFVGLRGAAVPGPNRGAPGPAASAQMN